MTRGQVRRRLSIAWWKYLALALVPLFVINVVFGQGEAILPVLAMPFFIAGVASMFVSLKFFGRYKHALIATQKALDTPEEPAAWIALAACLRSAYVVAALPAWVGALAVFDVGPVAALQDDRVDAGALEQPREEEAGGARSDDADGGAHRSLPFALFV